MAGVLTSDDEPAIALAGCGYVCLRLPISEHDAEGFCQEIEAGVARRVHVEDRPETWAEHRLSPDGNLARMMTSDSVLAVARAALRRSATSTLWPIFWGNVYRTGEHIPWHRDTFGAIQLLLCLRPAPEGCGGEFRTQRGGKVSQVPLDVGESILFKATELEHSTTPIVSSLTDAAPVRITAVARFFEADPLERR